MPIDEEAAVVSQPAPQPERAPIFAARWKLATRIAFRFCVVYFGLYIVLTQMLTSLLFATTNDSGAFEVDNLPPIKAAVVWIGAHVFRIAHPIVTYETGSGDRVYDWVELACIVALAILGTILWSVLDRKRESYPKLYTWFRLFARFSLAATMFTYGAVKAVPLQMPFPGLNRLLERYGDLSPMGVRWASIGASRAYEMFAGCAELLGGTLLVFPRTTALGALVCLADATEVFLLNMTYDVPVKLLSFHMILLSLFLLAPDAKRLANFFLLDRRAPRSSDHPLFRTARKNRIALAMQVLAGVFLIGANLYGSARASKIYGAASPKSQLYGIWNVENFIVDGQPHPPLLTDVVRWRRIVFDRPDYTTVYAMDDAAQFYAAKIDTKARTLTLTKYSDKNWKADLSFAQPDANHLTLDGTLDKHKVHAEFELLDRSKFLLVQRGFHWVQDRPFNR
ncbi:MAG: DoxX family protein [Candidatus Acidiferrales bacterium]